jgi:hypothetical protein
MHLAPIGIRELRFGPWRLRWGGAWYRIGPLSVLRWRQLFEAAGLLDPDKAARLVGADPVALLRPFLHLLVDDLNPRHLRRASHQQIADVIVGMLEANDFPAILTGFARLVRDHVTIDALTIKLAQALHCWPGEIVHQSAQEVFAVAAELGLLGAPFRGIEAGADADFVPKLDNKEVQ